MPADGFNPVRSGASGTLAQAIHPGDAVKSGTKRLLRTVRPGNAMKMGDEISEWTRSSPKPRVFRDERHYAPVPTAGQV